MGKGFLPPGEEDLVVSQNLLNPFKGQVVTMWWKRLGFGALVVLLAYSTFCAASAEANLRWRTYVTADGSVSFDYPEGWVVGEHESGFMIHDRDDTQQLWLVLLPFERTWTAREHAEYFLALIQAENPEMRATDWEVDDSGDLVLVELKYGSGRNSAQGYALVIKDSDLRQTIWYHYIAHRDLFDEDRALSILGDFAASLGSGTDSVPPPQVNARMERINRNVDGFLFILEFALGSPLTLAEENLITAELQGILMGYSDAELAQYADFPFYVQVIMALEDQQELADMKSALEEAIWEWIEESDPFDPIVSAIKEAMLEADRILVPGKTPLTEVAATAYGEFLAFAEQIESSRTADLRSISERRVREIKERLVEAWRGLNQQEKEQVLQLPAVWTTLRRVLNLGDDKDRAYAIQIIRDAAPPRRASSSLGADDEPMSWLQHQSMMQVHSTVCKNWLWAAGFNPNLVWWY